LIASGFLNPRKIPTTKTKSALSFQLLEMVVSVTSQKLKKRNNKGILSFNLELIGQTMSEISIAGIQNGDKNR
jgi:hypothetical protein